MKHLATALIVVAACGCAPPEAGLDQALAKAQSSLRSGKLAVAMELVDQAIAQTAPTPDSPWAWRFRLLRADVLISRLDFADALTILEAPVPPGASFDLLRARQQMSLARLRVAQGQLTPAMAALHEVRRLAPGDAELTFDADLLGSQILFRTAKWADAEGQLNGLIARAVSTRDDHRLAQALNNLGMGLVVRNRFDEALPYFERVLTVSALTGASVYGAAANNAGVCLARLGQFDRAIASQKRAVEIHKDGRQLDYQQALGELGTSYLLQDDIETSVPYLQQALAIATAAKLQTDALLWARNLAAAHVALGKWDDAARYNDEAALIDAPNRASKQIYGTVTAAQIAHGRGRQAEATTLFDDALARSAGEPAVRWMAYDGLARLAILNGQSAVAARHFEAALDTVEKTRSAVLRTDYRMSFLTRLIHFYRGYVDLLFDQGRVERALEVADSSRGRVLADRQGVAAPARATAMSLRRLARDARTVMLFYWLAPDRSIVWVVSGEGVRAVALPPSDQIAALVAEHQTTIENAMADPLVSSRTAGDRLYEMLVAPVASHIRPGTVVTIVPDGALHRLNFETLTAPAQGRAAKRYWIEDVTVQIAPALAMLQRPTPRPAAPSLLLVGNPTPRAPEFPALSYAPAEMNNVTKHFAASAVTTFDGAKASPSAFRDAQPNKYSVIHFTAHAVANPENPLDSAVILSGPDQSFKLYARDVAGIPLAAELVTVSACRSAGERAYSGEGLVGFAWAFLRAGSRRVVAGLWDVDDRSTAALMEHFYARLAEGDAPAAALRAAKLSIMKAGTVRPYYWAPLQMFTTAP